uniref:Uncharacterized protein n=1 Tax=Anguilla anguilla TaxID=7936 RepID=A0A0E9SW00_ANGAN
MCHWYTWKNVHLGRKYTEKLWIPRSATYPECHLSFLDVDRDL